MAQISQKNELENRSIGGDDSLHSQWLICPVRHNDFRQNFEIGSRSDEINGESDQSKGLLLLLHC